MVSIGKHVANFTLPATGDKTLSLDDFQGTHLVLYFYPKDHTLVAHVKARNFVMLMKNLSAPVLTSWAFRGTASVPTKIFAQSNLFLSTSSLMLMRICVNNLMLSRKRICTDASTWV